MQGLAALRDVAGEDADERMRRAGVRNPRAFARALVP
jgi:hypothetical protein